MPERPARHKPFCASAAKKHNSVDRRKSAARCGYVKTADAIREAFVCPVTCPVPLGLHTTGTAPVVRKWLSSISIAYVLISAIGKHG